MTRFLISMLELFGVVFLRFRPIPRLWCVWLVAVNLACLAFIAHVEAQVVLAVTLIAVVAQTVVYGRIGFTRVLGTTHVLWLPMFAWMATRMDAIRADPDLAHWLMLLFVTNMVSLAVDTADAVRFLHGEREPHYRWN
ncbi:hypothetical protein WDZ92_13595 [Nostoc sp. NIES-2111]